MQDRSSLDFWKYRRVREEYVSEIRIYLLLSDHKGWCWAPAGEVRLQTLPQAGIRRRLQGRARTRRTLCEAAIAPA